jgi:urease accessory protein
MAWHAQLQLQYTQEAGRTVARYQHSGPLRILQSLYPEGDTICHNVLIHPPGGLVGGDTLELSVSAAPDSHALITTPGATRFYRSEGPLAEQRTHIQLQARARLEWFPLETICYNQCNARNHLRIALEEDAEIMGWDVTSLGLPSAQLPFAHGQLEQHIEIPGVWLERGRIQAQDHGLMQSPLGLAGQSCMATLFFASGRALDRRRKEQALDRAQQIVATHALSGCSGATSPNAQVVLVRVLAPAVEPAMQLLRTVRHAWRQELWALNGTEPRIWSM